MDIKRRNQKFTNKEIELLNFIFKQSHKPNKQTRVRLANLFLKPERSIQIWFQNKRARQKKILPIPNFEIHIDYDYDTFDFLEFLK
jgi:hypothetical protein